MNTMNEANARVLLHHNDLAELAEALRALPETPLCHAAINAVDEARRLVGGLRREHPLHVSEGAEPVAEAGEPPALPVAEDAPVVSRVAVVEGESVA